MPGYGEGSPVRIEVLGPVVETDDDARSLLRWFHGDKGQTKNGHSVILRLEYGNVRILLGGDLNTAAEHHLLEQYTGLPTPPVTPEDHLNLVAAGRRHFEVDVAKACHHGSADFSDAFLASIHAAATVVSSGDRESHAHPRSDTLGALGQHGRGWRSLVFSTELARSVPDHDSEIRRLLATLDELEKATGEEEREELRRKLRDSRKELKKRAVTVYGTISMRTDGEHALMAYKLERDRRYGSRLTRWDVYPLERVGDGPMVYVPDR